MWVVQKKRKEKFLTPHISSIRRDGVQKFFSQIRHHLARTQVKFQTPKVYVGEKC